MKKEKAKKRLVLPRGLREKEKEKLTSALKMLKDVPRVTKVENVRVSLPSTMPTSQRKKIVSSLIKPLTAARELVNYNSVVEETIEESVEETVAEVEVSRKLRPKKR